MRDCLWQADFLLPCARSMVDRWPLCG